MHAPPTAPRTRRRTRALGFAALAVAMLMSVPTAQTAFGEEVQAVPGGGDLGPNVHVFDPSTPDIQGKVDEIFSTRRSASTRRSPVSASTRTTPRSTVM